MSIVPMAVYGLSVEANDIPYPAEGSVQGAFTITMAAIDPTEVSQQNGSSSSAVSRSTLKLIRAPLLDIDSESDFDEEEMEALLAENDSEDDDAEEESSDAEDADSNKKSGKNARNIATAKKLQELLKSDGMEVELPNGVNGKASKGKGKAKAAAAVIEAESQSDEDEDDESDDGESTDGVEEFVICTLDPEKTIQQPLNITIGADEEVYFKVTGSHTIHLTGNYVEPADTHDHDHDDYEDSEDDEDDMYGLYPGAEELDDEDDEDDELDDIEDPRITEMGEDDEDEEAPVLVTKADKKADKVAKKGKNKRAADDSADETAAGETVDELIAKAGGEQKLSKKQQKKLKNNEGKAVPAATAADAAVETPDKKVQFADKLVQGPTPGKPHVVQGVTIDDKKLGEGRAAKAGNTIAMRYIGKLQNGTVFDSNKKGKPFTFKLGKGEVIKGWDIGIAGMKIGGERRITVPAAQAYGFKSMPGIPSNSILIFDVKCLEIK